MDRVLAVILGGGQGTRLFPLTQYRSKPAVPIGGKYRLIDIPISNCLHSGVQNVYVLTQFNSASLNRHVHQTYRFDAFSDGFVEILAAEQTQDNAGWYQGTADAVRQQFRHFSDNRVDQYLILSGDHLYRMDYRPFVEAHRERNAEVTIAVKPVSREAAPDLGILKTDDEGWIVDFREKPQTDSELDELRIHSGGGEAYPASMGIYIFETEVLTELLDENPQDDFGKHIIPEAIRSRRVLAYPFEGYWEDIGTIRSFYNANVALTEREPPFDFHRSGAQVYTHPRYLAGAKVDGCTIRQSIVGEGSDIRGTEIVRSVIGIRSIVGPNVRLSSTVMMGADYYETRAEIERNRKSDLPNVGIGEGCVIQGAIIDKNARIGRGVTIQNGDAIGEAEGKGFVVRDGIVVVPKNAVIRDGTVI